MQHFLQLSALNLLWQLCPSFHPILNFNEIAKFELLKKNCDIFDNLCEFLVWKDAELSVYEKCIKINSLTAIFYWLNWKFYFWLNFTTKKNCKYFHEIESCQSLAKVTRLIFKNTLNQYEIEESLAENCKTHAYLSYYSTDFSASLRSLLCTQM